MKNFVNKTRYKFLIVNSRANLYKYIDKYIKM